MDHFHDFDPETFTMGSKLAEVAGMRVKTRPLFTSKENIENISEISDDFMCFGPTPHKDAVLENALRREGGGGQLRISSTAEWFLHCEKVW